MLIGSLRAGGEIRIHLLLLPPARLAVLHRSVISGKDKYLPNNVIFITKVVSHEP